MILHKETYEKYGYWPKDLTRGSDKYVLVKCPICSKIYNLAYNKEIKKKSDFCKKCGYGIMVRAAKKQTLENDFEINPALFLKLYLSYSISPSLTKFNPRLTGDSRNNKNYNVLDTEIILKKINYNNRFSFKENLLEYLKTRDKQYCWSVENLIINYTRSFVRFKTLRGAGYSKKYEKLFKVLDPENSYMTRGGIAIKKGAFFINNRWVYIGE